MQVAHFKEPKRYQFSKEQQDIKTAAREFAKKEFPEVGKESFEKAILVLRDSCAVVLLCEGILQFLIVTKTSVMRGAGKS